MILLLSKEIVLWLMGLSSLGIKGDLSNDRTWGVLSLHYREHRRPLEKI